MSTHTPMTTAIIGTNRNNSWRGIILRVSGNGTTTYDKLPNGRYTFEIDLDAHTIHNAWGCAEPMSSDDLTEFNADFGIWFVS